MANYAMNPIKYEIIHEKKALKRLLPDLPKRRRTALAILIVKARRDMKAQLKQRRLPASGDLSRRPNRA